MATKKSADNQGDTSSEKAPKNEDATPSNAGSSNDDTVSAGFGDKIRLGDAGRKLAVASGATGALALVAALALGLGDTRQLFHSYLVSFMWLLSISLGALWWVTLQHLVNAKWSIAIRRVGELMARNVALAAVLSLPIVIPALMGNAELFPWADAHSMHENHALHQKAAYLNVTFFAVRCAIYFGFWIWLSRFFFKRSVLQDTSKRDPVAQTRTLRAVSGPSMLAIALTLTFASIDFVMSLDPMWFSTMFGIYYFAGCVLAVHSVMALALMWLQRNGVMTKSITSEHFHDIGKMMFAFTVFWAYVAFSQFMLIWYANIPEETAWYKLRFNDGWGTIAWLLLVCHFVIPFFGLLSRHVKRHRFGLAIAAVWILVIHWLDLYWLVMPNLFTDGPAFQLVDFLCLIGMAGLFIAAVALQARKVNLIPIKDPRLNQSLAFENV